MAAKQTHSSRVRKTVTHDSGPPPPRGEVLEYNQFRHGFWGEFGGSDGDSSVKFLETGFGMSELDKLTLVADIAESEKWPITELFQRDIDETRVENEILPYLQTPGKIRFINPLTVALVPVDASGRIISSPLAGQPRTEVANDLKYTIFDVKGYYSAHRCDTQAAYSRIRWLDSNVKLVAIDGQHRLSALKRLRTLMNSAAGRIDASIANWTVPAILVVMPELHWNPDGRHASHIVEAIRSIFVHVNQTAQAASFSRTVLLDDTDLLALCCQEFLQACHEGKTGTVPLHVFDWRNDENHPSPSAILSAKELYHCFEHYILGEDIDLWLQALDVKSDESKRPLSRKDFLQKTLREKERNVLASAEAERRARKRFRDTVMPGVMQLMANLSPFAAYIRKLTTLQNKLTKDGRDIAVHALDRLCYGRSREDERLRGRVSEAYEKLETEVSLAREAALSDLLKLDIGIRALFYSFGRLKRVYDEAHQKTSEWHDYAKWYVTAANSVVANGWFDTNVRQKDLLHVCRDEHDATVNYRYEQVDSGLGALIALKCIESDTKVLERVAGNSDVGMDVGEIVESLRKTVRKGYERQIRPKWKEKIQDNTKERNKNIREEAEKMLARRMKTLLHAQVLELVE